MAKIVGLDYTFEAKELPPPPCFNWSSGASAQIEIVASRDADYNKYYVLPQRPAIRPPIRQSGLTAEDFKMLDTRLKEVMSLLNKTDGSRSMPRAVSPEDSETPADPAAALKSLGEILYDTILPSDLQEALEGKEGKECFLEIGVDEELNRYPLELMNDGKDFLCLRATNKMIFPDTDSI